MLHRVKRVEYLTDYKLKLYFTNGKIKVIDLADDLIKAKNMFLDLADIDYFRKVTCDGYSICWPNGIDFCPDWLYMNSKDLVRMPPKRRKSSTKTKFRKKRSIAKA